MKRAIITGVLGQDGSYLSEHLLSLGYEVLGVYRRISTGENMQNIAGVVSDSNFSLVAGDICDHTWMANLVKEYQPDEFYNLAAMSHVGHSFEIPVETFRVDAEAVIGQLQSIKQFSPNTKYYQASTSELFGGVDCPADGYHESSPLNPRSPYAIAKTAAFYSVKNFRERSDGVYAVNGILFNHSSPRRGHDFATRKITRGLARIKLGKQEKIKMGNLSACRDEGHAKDYVRAMHLMLQQEKPKDFCVATGVSTSIENMFRHVAEHAGLSFEDCYEMDERFMRPSEVPYLVGNPQKIRSSIEWEPEYTWQSLLEEMYENDLKEES
jgi:GDPmannose 4,6-dehydratase